MTEQKRPFKKASIERVPARQFKVITLVGPVKFKEEFERLNAELTLAGNVVFAPAVYSTYNGEEINEEQKRILVDVHLQKIDMSDEILVVNVCGYMGMDTHIEIDHAKTIGIPITFLEPINDIQ